MTKLPHHWSKKTMVSIGALVVALLLLATFQFVPNARAKIRAEWYRIVFQQTLFAEDAANSCTWQNGRVIAASTVAGAPFVEVKIPNSQVNAYLANAQMHAECAYQEGQGYFDGL